MAGKGGVGKTTLSGLIVGALLRRREGAILAIDADPNACLADSLGVEVEQTLGAIRDEILVEKDRLPPGLGKPQLVEMKTHQCIVEGEGFDLLEMGRTEGPGCYCYVNNLLREFVQKLEPNYRFVVMDNEAGMEHLSRRTARNVDHLLVVADGSLGSIRAAERIRDLVDELGIRTGTRHLVLNRGGSTSRGVLEGLPTIGTVPMDPSVSRAEAEGTALLRLPETSPAPAAVSEMIDRLLAGGGEEGS
ncbi:MAG: ATP-binding protein [Planctomycetota bacterium]